MKVMWHDRAAGVHRRQQRRVVLRSAVDFDVRRVEGQSVPGGLTKHPSRRNEHTVPLRQVAFDELSIPPEGPAPPLVHRLDLRKLLLAAQSPSNHFRFHVAAPIVMPHGGAQLLEWIFDVRGDPAVAALLPRDGERRDPEHVGRIQARDDHVVESDFRYREVDDK